MFHLDIDLLDDCKRRSEILRGRSKSMWVEKLRSVWKKAEEPPPPWLKSEVYEWGGQDSKVGRCWDQTSQSSGLLAFMSECA